MSNLRQILDRKRQQIRTFGLVLSMRATAVLLLRRIINFEICRVTRSANTTLYPCPPGYKMAVADLDAFAALADTDTVNAQLHAFANGDYAVVTTHAGALVGYNFYSENATRVNDEVEFRLHKEYVYSYGAYTHPDHRGLGLSPARWTFAKQWRDSQGIEQPTISYIALDNLASLQSGDNSHTLIGYSGYIGWAWQFTAGRWQRRNGPLHCFNSAGCRRAGVGFYSASSVSANKSAGAVP